MLRWLDFIMECDFEIKNLKSKLNVVADALSRRDYPLKKSDQQKAEKLPKILKRVTFNWVHALKPYSQDDTLENYPIQMYRPMPILKGKGSTSKNSINSDDHKGGPGTKPSPSVIDQCEGHVLQGSLSSENWSFIKVISNAPAKHASRRDSCPSTDSDSGSSPEEESPRCHQIIGLPPPPPPSPPIAKRCR